MDSEAITDGMIEAALATEFEGSPLRNIVNAQLWHHGAYGNAKALVRSALENALRGIDDPATLRADLAAARAEIGRMRKALSMLEELVSASIQGPNRFTLRDKVNRASAARAALAAGEPNAG